PLESAAQPACSAHTTASPKTSERELDRTKRKRPCIESLLRLRRKALFYTEPAQAGGIPGARRGASAGTPAQPGGQPSRWRGRRGPTAFGDRSPLTRLPVRQSSAAISAAARAAPPVLTGLLAAGREI